MTPADFALAVAARAYSAMLLDSENRNAGEVSVDRAIAEDLVYAIVPRNGLVAVDVDIDDDHERVKTFSRVHPDIAYVDVSSGGNPRDGQTHAPRHRWYVTPSNMGDDELRDRLIDAAVNDKSVRKAGIGGRIRPPLSRHRKGVRGEILNVSPEEALTLFQEAGIYRPDTTVKQPEGQALPAPVPSENETVVHHPPKDRTELSETGWDVIRRGMEGGKGYANRSAASAAAAMHVLHAGQGLDDFRRYHQDPANRVGEKYRKMAEEDPAKAEKKLQEWWSGAVRNFKPGHGEWSQLTREQIESWRAGCHAWPYWPPQKKGTMLALVDTLAGYAIEKKSGTIYPGIRRLVERSAGGKDTIARNLRTLNQWGFIDIRDDVTDGAQRLTLNLERVSAPTSPTPETTTFLPEESRVWRNRVYGSTARDVYLCLTNKGSAMTAAEMVKESGRARSTVERQLRKLSDESAGQSLVERLPNKGGWRAVHLPDLEAAEAAILDHSEMTDKEARDRGRHGKERGAWQIKTQKKVTESNRRASYLPAA